MASFAAPAAASADGLPPHLESWELSSTTADIGDGPAQVIFRARLTDADGVDWANVTFEQFRNLGRILPAVQLALVEGTATDGIWEGRISARLSVGSAIIGRGSAVLSHAGSAGVRGRMSRSGRARLARRRRVTAVLTATITGRGGQKRDIVRPVTLR